MLEPMQPALAGRLVLSVGHTLPGLYCLAMLRDLGAEVVRIERPTRDAASPYEGVANDFPTRSLVAGTHALALDLKHAAGRDAFLRMAARADVVLEGFRPGVSTRLGIDYETLHTHHDALVHAAISGHGEGAREPEHLGHDVNYLAETGVLALANPLGLPGVPFADGLAGLAAALNVVAALHAATISGRGQHLDCAIVDGPLFLMSAELEHFWRSGESRGPGDTHLSGRHPWYGLHPSADGGAMAVGAVEPPFHAALCRTIGHPELTSRQHAEGEEADAARELIGSAFSTRTRAEAASLFEGGEACVSPVRTTAEVAGSDLVARGVREDESSGERLVRSPVRLPSVPLAPEISAETLLAGLGFGAEEIESLIDSGACEEA
jgi:crotonobetainyl-CoA:carnitine CoA-transferase CaiB-like acyl-CoA transferase